MVFLNDIVGEVLIDTSHLRQFVQAWFKPEDTVAIVAISPERHGRKPLSQPATARELMNIDAVDISQLSMLKNGEKFNTYITVYPIRDSKQVELHKRGGEENVRDVYGVFVDLDVKPGCFDNKEQIFEFLTTEVPRPTIVIENGETGGIHAYWRLPWDETADKSLLTRWYSYISEKAGDRKIDKLVDVTRVSRMPSGIYWPKDKTAGKVDTVKTVWVDGPQYSLQYLLDISQEAFERRTNRIQKLWKDDAQSRLSADELARLAMEEDEDLDGWALYQAIASVEEQFNSIFSWDDILEPMGWTYIREDNRGRREWARPGQSAKSATTDYEESPDMMSLLSSSEDTGLADLKDAGIALTKWRVAQRLLFDDDVEALTRHVLKVMKTRG